MLEKTSFPYYFKAILLNLWYFEWSQFHIWILMVQISTFDFLGFEISLRSLTLPTCFHE